MSDADSDTASDELDAPDYRLMPLLSRSTYTLPSRGEKDFEPDGTRKQGDHLMQSRKALYDAIAVQRSLPPDCARCIWDPILAQGIVAHPKGPLFKSMGRSFGPANACALLPEEVLLLLDRGCLVCTLKDDPYNIPLSVQAVYAFCLSHLSLAQYQVYSHLKRAGFHVLRVQPTKHTQPSLFDSLNRATRRVTAFWQRQRSGCLSARHVYRSYAQVYDHLAMSPCYDPRELPTNNQPTSDLGLRLCYDVWKPGSFFKKSNPGEPHLRMALCSTDTAIPSLDEMDHLFAQVRRKQGKATLKDGWRETLVLAVVDAGVMSFLRLSDISFHLHSKPS
jgi:tRNA-splicing endonuclease subunit Sen54